MTWGAAFWLLLAVVIASVFNFVANDLWTFGRFKMNRAARQAHRHTPHAHE